VGSGSCGAWSVCQSSVCCRTRARTSSISVFVAAASLDAIKSSLHAVELERSSLAGAVPIEMFGKSLFPRLLLVQALEILIVRTLYGGQESSVMHVIQRPFIEIKPVLTVARRGRRRDTRPWRSA
jgi:hypothetical protein